MAADHIHVMGQAHGKAMPLRPARRQMTALRQLVLALKNPQIDLWNPESTIPEVLGEPMLPAPPLIAMKMLVFLNAEEKPSEALGKRWQRESCANPNAEPTPYSAFEVG